MNSSDKLYFLFDEDVVSEYREYRSIYQICTGVDYTLSPKIQIDTRVFAEGGIIDTLLS